jgi:hypothetical protein
MGHFDVRSMPNLKTDTLTKRATTKYICSGSFFDVLNLPKNKKADVVKSPTCEEYAPFKSSNKNDMPYCLAMFFEIVGEIVSFLNPKGS